MWLIDTTNFELKHFIACPVDTYAILSHTWEGEELNFDLFRDGGGRSLKGYQKIQYCCDQAKADGYKCAWVDTVCIDKRSSTDLSEAINSMFAWYANAGVCYVYLEELHNRASMYNIGQCRWFSRGWTLQELLAPKKVLFFTFKWKVIGTRESMSRHLAKITDIDEQVLTKKVEIRDCSVAARMSWASQRETTRAEDVAYCLLGIFGVNIPLLYGEGEKAFRRLQEAIVFSSDDESIFAWTGVTGPSGTGLLADSPVRFANTADIVASPNDSGPAQGSPLYSTTNRGLAIERQLLPMRMNTYLSPLKCYRRRHGWSPKVLGIYICRTDLDQQYRRILVDGVDLPVVDNWKAKYATQRLLYFNDNISLSLAPHGCMPLIRSMYIPLGSPLTNSEIPSPTSTSWKTIAVEDFRARVICIDQQDQRRLLVRFGFNADFEPVCLLYRFGLFNSRASIVKHLQANFTTDLRHSEVDFQLAPMTISLPDTFTWCLRGDRTSGLHTSIRLRWMPSTFLNIKIFPVIDPECSLNASTWYVAMCESKVDPSKTDLPQSFMNGKHMKLMDTANARVIRTSALMAGLLSCLIIDMIFVNIGDEYAARWIIFLTLAFHISWTGYRELYNCQSNLREAMNRSFGNQT